MKLAFSVDSRAIAYRPNAERADIEKYNKDRYESLLQRTQKRKK